MADQILSAPLAIQRVFHPTDLSPPSETAFVHALKLGLLFKAELHILHARHPDYDETAQYSPSITGTLERWGLHDPGSPPQDAESIGIRVTTTRTEDREPAEAICRHLEGYPADLIVLTTHHREGLSGLLHQSVAEAVARQTHVKTLFLPSQVEGFVSKDSGSVKLERILIPAAQSPAPQPAVDTACALASALGCETLSVQVVHVGRRTGLPPLQIPKREGWALQTTVCKGDVVDWILNFGAEFKTQLLVMPTEGHKGVLDDIFGSTTERVLRDAGCPLLAVPTG